MSEDSSLKRTRASGEVLEYLLREFDVNQNPSPDQRKEISERTGMNEKAVRIWFQNRRAKLRKFERMGRSIKSPSALPQQDAQNFAQQDTQNYAQQDTQSYVPPSRSSLLTNIPVITPSIKTESQPQPMDLSYSLVDCSSLSVGSWQRVRSGNYDPSMIQTLDNLAPFTVNNFMSEVDLSVILSRKNNEINYFFSAMSNGSKILFRIFYPVTTVVLCSLLDNSISKENNELRICLSEKPSYSVYFSNGVDSNLNKWLICDDFSEGLQVSSAFFAAGGNKIPHVLVGIKLSLEFLHLFLMENAQGPHLHPAYRSLTPANMGNGFKQLHLHESHNASQNSETFPHSEVNQKNYIDLPREQGGKSDFQIKHELHSWNGSTPSDLGYDLKPTMTSEDYDGTKSGHDRPSSTVQNPESYDTGVTDQEGFTTDTRKQDGNYTELFTETPDFFSTVQTPNNNLIPAHTTTQENLIHSPSTNVRNFDGPQQNHYGFDINMADDYQNSVPSPSVSNTVATPNTVASNSNVDTFIDYNGNL